MLKHLQMEAVAFGLKYMPLFELVNFCFKELDIYMNLHCEAKAQDCQDYSECDCVDETACG